MVVGSINEARVELFEEVLASDETYFLTSTRVTDFTDLAVAVDRTEPTAHLNVLTDDDTVTELRRRFLTASHLTDFIESGQFEFRSQGDGGTLPSYVLTETELHAITGIDDDIIDIFSRSDTAFVADTYAEVEDRFEAGERVTLRAPAYSQMLTELGAEFDDTVETDVRTMLDEAYATRDDEAGIEPVRISILAGAKNEVQFYKLGRWGENTRVGSRSKFSREKNKLEDLGVVDTEKMQTGVGRPRQRLVLADDVKDSDVEDLLSLTESVLN